MYKVDYLGNPRSRYYLGTPDFAWVKKFTMPLGHKVAFASYYGYNAELLLFVWNSTTEGYDYKDTYASFSSGGLYAPHDIEYNSDTGYFYVTLKTTTGSSIYTFEIDGLLPVYSIDLIDINSSAHIYIGLSYSTTRARLVATRINVTTDKPQLTLFSDNGSGTISFITSLDIGNANDLVVRQGIAKKDYGGVEFFVLVIGAGTNSDYIKQYEISTTSIWYDSISATCSATTGNLKIRSDVTSSQNASFIYLGHTSYFYVFDYNGSSISLNTTYTLAMEDFDIDDDLVVINQGGQVNLYELYDGDTLIRLSSPNLNESGYVKFAIVKRVSDSPEMIIIFTMDYETTNYTDWRNWKMVNLIYSRINYIQ